MDFLLPFYDWARAFHIISIIAWMAGLLYLPRLFIYHHPTAVGSEASETFKVMERRLLRAIMNPAMIAAWIFGLTLVMTPGVLDWSQGWVHVKATAVILLTASHMMMASARKKFDRDERPKSTLYFRILNEVPTLLMIIIVIMVVVRLF